MSSDTEQEPQHQQPYRPELGSPRRPVPVEHHLWLHSIESSALAAFGLILIAAVLPHAVPLWFIATTGATLAAVLWFVSLTVTGSLGMAGYLLAWGIVAAGWLTAERVAGLWRAEVLAGLILPTLILAPLGAVAIGHYRDRGTRDAKTEDRDRADAAIREWQNRFRRVGADRVTVLEVIKNPGGVQVHGRLPRAVAGKITLTMDMIKNLETSIATDMRLAKGAVQIGEGATSADFVVNARTKKGKRETVFLPAENLPQTVNRPFGLGLYDNGKPFQLLYREVAVIIIGVRGSGKALSLDTPLATPSGWTTMGEIRPGDQVFDEAGRPVRVLAATGVMHGRPCYEVEFSDGTVITADGGHQWLVDTDGSRRSERRKNNPKPRRRPGLEMNHGQEHLRKRPEILTTEQMIPGLRVMRRSGSTTDGGQNNYSVRVAAPLRCPAADLPVPPYTLGAWLGDGWSATGAITTADHEILAEIEAEGWPVWIMPSTVEGAAPYEAGPCALAGPSCSPSGEVAARRLCVNHLAVERRAGRLDQWPLIQRDTTRRERLAGYRVGGLSARLRDAGVLGNKHIPVSYLRASEDQRRALLAGLLDTDGYCSSSGTAEFCSSREQLARDVYRLVCSLGYKAAIRSKTARLDGRNCGTAWIVAFTPADKVFRLPRKVARQVTTVRATAPHRYVTAIRPVPSVPVRCIEVDSPEHLYLAGESCVPTHNSNLINVFLAQLARCIDASVFMIDLKGGRAARPWMMPWVRGHTRRPVVDWLATTREEAVLMLDALLRAGDARARGAAGGWEKLEPTFEMPAIILVVDETAVMTGHNIRDDGISNTAIAQKLAQLTETYRSEAIDPLVAALRGNVDIMGSTAVKAMSEVRIGLRVTQASDGQSVFPDDYNAAKALSTITDEGAGLAKVGATVSPVIHFYRMTEERITAIATWAGNETTPDLETRVQEAMGPAYATRWERDHGMKLKSEWREQAGMPEPLPVNDEFEQIIGQIDDPEKQVDPRHKKMREVVRQSGFRGLTVARITRRLADAGMTTPRETVHRWLVKDEEDGYVRRSGPPHNLWHWVTPEPLDSLPGMQPDELAGDDDDED